MSTANAHSRHSPIDVPPRSYGPLKDQAASDAEVEVRKTIPFGPLKDSLPKVGEEDKRPGTAPSGPAEVNDESRRRDLAVMQDFFKETSLREKLQEQCDDLTREIDRVQSTNTKLRKQLVDAQSAVTEKDKAVASAGSDATGWDETKHNTIVDGMEKKFALETQLLEEQKQKLKEEKRVAQEKEAAESAKAAELQQVLDDLNVELERQGREWDAEKLQLADQGAKIEALTDELSRLKKERDTLSADLASANSTLEDLQAKLTDLEHSQTNQLRKQDDTIGDLTRTIEALRAKATATEQRHTDATEEAKRSLETTSSETSKLVDELQAKMASLEQEHTDELRQKDEVITSHLKTESELKDAIVKLQQRADQTTADLENERTVHAETLKSKISEIQESSEQALIAQKADVSGHLESIGDLQSQITALQQGKTDGAKLSQELTQQLEDLKASHGEAIRLKTEQNDELVRQLKAIDGQLSSDASAMKELREEADGLRKTMESLEHAAKQDGDSHATALNAVRKELAETNKKADSYKADLEAAKDRHRQDLRVLGEDHDAEIDSLRADLEGDAKKRLDKLQAEYDALVAEKNATLEGHEKSLTARASELEEAQREISALKDSSGSTSQGLDEANAKYQQVVQEKSALAEAHYTAQKQVADLEARVEALTKENALIADLQARMDAMIEDKQAADETLAASDKSFSELKAQIDSLTAEKQALTEQFSDSEKYQDRLQEELELSSQEKQTLETSNKDLEMTVADLTARHDALLKEKSVMEESHTRTVSALKQDSENNTKEILDEIQSKYDSLLKEKASRESVHASELGDIQSKCDSLAKQLAEVQSKLEGSTTALKAAEDAQAAALDEALQSQRHEMDEKYVSLLEEVQADCNKLEQEIGKAITERQIALTELDTLKSDMQAEIDDLKHELIEKEELDSAGLAEVSKKYETLLVEQSAADKEAHEVAVEELASTLRTGYEHAKQEAHAELEHLKDELMSKDKSHAIAMAEAVEEHKALLAKQSVADRRDHEVTLALLKEALTRDLTESKENYETVLIERDSLKRDLTRAAEAADTDLTKLRQDLETRKQCSAAEVKDLTEKLDALLLENLATDEAHGKALSSLRESIESDLEHSLVELQSQNRQLQDKFAKVDEVHQQTLVQLRAQLEADHSSNANTLRQQLECAQTDHTEATEQMVKAHQDAVSELMIVMQNSATDAAQQVQKKHDALEVQMEALQVRHNSELEAMHRDRAEQQRSHDDLQTRLDKTVADLEAASEDVRRLQESFEAIEAERDRAHQAVVEAEDRIETFKGEVVRKHLARVEPLEKENTALLNKIDRLQDMLAAGDRIARAAASLGEKREMTVVAEESEEEHLSAPSVRPRASAHEELHAAPVLNGTAKDVVGTVSLLSHLSPSACIGHKLTEHQQLAAMQETLSQLNALNNDAIAESERTAQRLTERD